MYDELVKRLNVFRLKEDEYQIIPVYVSEIIGQAADAIEELTAYVRQIEELRKDGYYLQKTKKMTYGQATMTQPLPEPPKMEAEGGKQWITQN
jgi:hypothetical protein